LLTASRFSIRIDPAEVRAMSEKEIRSILQRVCREIDRRAKQVVYPTVLGAGLALGGCGDNRTVGRPDMAYGVADYRHQRDMGLPDYMLYSAPDAAYMAPDFTKMDKSFLEGPQPVYSAPDSRPTDTRPTDARPTDKGKLDSRPPWPDGGGMLYMAPDPDPKIK
jgi:hypothetical protein